MPLFKIKIIGRQKMTKVEQLANNQFSMKDHEKTIFQSYDTVICEKWNSGQIFLDSETWNCSKTTSKYRNIFLNETTKETQIKIDKGIYTLANLNKGEF